MDDCYAIVKAINLLTKELAKTNKLLANMQKTRRDDEDEDEDDEE